METIAKVQGESLAHIELAVIWKHSGAFAIQTLKGFRANQGLLLAGAVAYYALLSIVPLLILIVIALSHVIDQAELLHTLGRYMEWLIPGQSKSIVIELENFLEHRDVIGWMLLVTMIFFSSLAFTVLENAMSVIFIHRVAIRRRHFLVSALLPYCYILCLGLGMLLVTLVSGSLQAMGQESVDFWDVPGPSGEFPACFSIFSASSEKSSLSRPSTWSCRSDGCRYGTR